MVKYKINNIFKDNHSLNDILVSVLKVELYKKYKVICKNHKSELPSNCTHYSQMERSS